jgi:membrane protein required for colicin V production
MNTWNWLDWALAGVVLVSTVTAVAKGFVRELISLAALVAGLVVAALYYERAASWFQDLTISHQAAEGIGFLVLFLGVLIVGAIVSSLARKLIRTAGLQWFDRSLGALFGLLRGLLVDSVLLMVLVAFAIKVDSVQRSVLAPYVTAGARVLVLAMPDELKTQFREGFEKFRAAVNRSDRPTTKK